MLEIINMVIKTGGGAFFSLLFGVLSTKVVAIFLGPSGTGLLSLLRQLRNTAQSVTTLNSRTALVQGIAHAEGNAKTEYGIVTSVLIGGFTLMIAALILVFAESVGQFTFGDSLENSTELVRWLVLPVVLGSILIYLQSLLNGFRHIGLLVVSQIAVSITTFLIIYPVVILVIGGSNLAFIGMMTFSTLIGVIVSGYFLIRELGKLQISTIQEVICHYKVFRPHATYFLTFAFATLISGSAMTWSILIVRSLINSNLGLEAAGFFDVAWTLSMTYVTLVLSSFGTYYLPTLSQLKSINERLILINRVFRLALALVVPLITAVILLKPLAINLLYSDEFLDAINIVRWMLIGDYLKSTSWVFGVTITAFADKKALLISEIGWYLGFVVMVYFSLTSLAWLEGVGIAFLVMYLFHLCYTSWYARSVHQLKFSNKQILLWVSGLAIILSASYLSWDLRIIRWWSSFLLILVSVCFSYFSLTGEERVEIVNAIFSRISRYKAK